MIVNIKRGKITSFKYSLTSNFIKDLIYITLAVETTIFDNDHTKRAKLPVIPILKVKYIAGMAKNFKVPTII